MRFRNTRGAVVGVATIGLVVSPLAAAAEPPSEVDRLAAHIADVAPYQGEVIHLRETGKRKEKRQAKETEDLLAQADRAVTGVEVSLDPEVPITIDIADAAVDLPQLEVSLPAEIEVAEGEVAADGTVVYQATDGGSDAAVQGLEDGSVRLQTVIPEAGAQHEFTYAFGGAVVPVENERGVIELVEEFDGGTITYGEVDEAWAVDANGNDIATYYRVEDGAVVQVVEADDETVYPIVADPKIAYYGVYTRITFNRSESAKVLGGVGSCWAFLSKATHPALKALSLGCGALGAYGTAQLAAGKCLRVQIVGIQPPFGTWWPSYPKCS